MKKEERIERYGIEAYEKRLKQTRDWGKQHRKEKKDNSRKWDKTHPEEAKERKRLWALNNPEKVEESNHEVNRKGGKYYKKPTGIRGERQHIRVKHGRFYRPYKQIIAVDSVLHHQWLPGTADYTGVALVEKDPHQHGYIDVIQILEGKITLLSEAEIRMGGSKSKK